MASNDTDQEDLEARIRYWTTEQPDCTREEALAVIASEDAARQIRRLDILIHKVDSEPMLRAIEKASRKMIDAFAAEAGITIAK